MYPTSNLFIVQNLMNILQNENNRPWQAGAVPGDRKDAVQTSTQALTLSFAYIVKE